MAALDKLKFDFEKQKSDELKKFLKSSDKIDFTLEENPIVSVILVLYNRAELTYACLKSLKTNCQLPIEIVCIDNNSSDKTRELFKKVSGVKYIRNKENSGFLKACNKANYYANGKYLLFLNNDAVIRPLAIEKALNVFQTEDKVGAVGARIILLDGNLQEAGSICWSDGSCLGYGRGMNPELPQFMFRRKVNFCSGAFLLTPKRLFDNLDGFDERYYPAYYEETDYCLSLQKMGYDIYYEPNSVIDHFEFASSTQSSDAIDLQKKNRSKFFEKHKEYLAEMCEPDLKNVLQARQINKSKKILFIDDRIPHQDLGAGFPRSNLILSLLVDSGYDVTVYSLNFPKEDDWLEMYRDIDPKVEMVYDYRRERIKKFIKERKDYYDLIWVSRPHNFEFLIDKISDFGDCKVIYDAEAVFSERDIEKARLEGKKIDPEKILQDELALCEYADAVVTVKETDKELFFKYGNDYNYVLNVAFNIPEYQAPFESRHDLLFVGNLDHDDSPNVDSVVWFVDHVFPEFKNSIPDCKLHLVGSSKSKIINDLGKKNKDIIVHGRIDDLTNIYNQCRVFLAPTRYAAGSPAKVFMAAAHGIPIIASDLIIRQLQWVKESQIEGCTHKDHNAFTKKLIQLYTDKIHWEKIKSNALLEIKNNHTISAYQENLERIISNTLKEPSERKIKETTVDEISHLPLVKIKEKMDELKHEKIELQNQLVEGEKYVLKLLDEISKKNAEIEKRGHLIAELEQRIFVKLFRLIKRPFTYITKIFNTLAYYLGFTLKFIFAFITNPIATIKQLKFENVRLFIIALKNEPISVVLSNIKKKLTK